jgi:hypothetical protein
MQFPVKSTWSYHEWANYRNIVKSPKKDLNDHHQSHKIMKIYC